MKRADLERLKTLTSLMRLVEERKRDQIGLRIGQLRADASRLLRERTARHSERYSADAPDLSVRLGNDLRWEESLLRRVTDLREDEMKLAVEHQIQARKAGHAMARDEVIARLITKSRRKTDYR